MSPQLLRRSFFGVLCLSISAGPLFADLDVTLIERLPRYDYDAAKNKPDPNELVSFCGHVINWSDGILSPDYLWQIDGVTVEAGNIGNLGIGEERILTFNWRWQDGDHTVTLITDPEDHITESSESNNSISDHINAIIAGFWVEQSVYDYFHEYQWKLGIGSNSWQDWIQRQMAKQNQLYEQAIWPISPQGVLDRVRIDKIIVVPDGSLPLNGGLPSNHPDTRDKTVDLMWGFPATLLDGSMYASHRLLDENNPFYIEKSLIHELGHARYLIDCYGFDVHNTASHHSVQIWEGETYVGGSEYMPFLAWGEVLYYNQSGGVMSGPYGFQWSAYEAAALNLIAGRRAQCGNYNAPCNIGSFLQDLPQNNHVRLLDSEGKPWVGANVRIYQAAAGPGWYGKTIDNDWDQQYTTDIDGYIHLPRNPFNPGGDIIHTHGHANGVMVLRIAYGDQRWYRFMEVTELNIQYWLGNTQDAYHTIELDGLNHHDTSPPSIPTKLRITKVAHDEISLQWQASVDDIGVVGYEVYRDGVAYGTTETTSFTDANVADCTGYSYTVSARDVFNESGRSDPCTASTPAGPQETNLNGDQEIDLADLALLCSNWLSAGCGTTGDFNADEGVDLLDFSMFAADYPSEINRQANWPMRQRDMHHTGRADYAVPASRMNREFFDTILWQQPSPGSPGAGNFSGTSMTFFDGVGPAGEDVVVGGYHWPKGIQAMDRQTGATLWYGNPDGGETIARSTPAFSNDGTTIYVVNDATSHPLMAFKTVIGPGVFWHNGADPEPDALQLNCPTIGPDGNIWLHRWDDRPYAGADYGDMISRTWGAATSVHTCFSDPVLYEDGSRLIVVSGGRSGFVKAWDGVTAAELWSVWTGDGTDATATIDPDTGNIYLAAGFSDTYIVGLDKNGQPLWSDPAICLYDSQSGSKHPHRAQSAGCLSHDAATYYFQTNSNQGDGLLYAVNTVDGSVKWSYPTGSKGWEIDSSSPVVTENGVVIVGNNEGGKYLALLDDGSGPLLLDSYTVDATGGAKASGTLSADGVLYIPLRTAWTAGNGDNETPTGNIENVFTAFSLR